MTDEPRERRTRSNRNYLLMRSLLDYGMGAIYMMIGILFLWVKYINIEFIDQSPRAFKIALGAIFIVYGAFRIYRGFKKNY